MIAAKKIYENENSGGSMKNDIFDRMTSMCEDFQLTTSAVNNTIREAKAVCNAVAQRIENEKKQAAAKCAELENKISDTTLSPAVRRLLGSQLEDLRHSTFTITAAEAAAYKSLIAESLDAERQLYVQLREFENLYNSAKAELESLRKKVMGDSTVTLCDNWRADAEKSWIALVKKYGEP